MRNYTFLLMIFSVPLLAELKPVSNVEADLCGWLNRSERLCTASGGASETKSEYIFLNHFLGANKAIGPATKKVKGDVTTYTAKAVDRDQSGKYQVEKIYKLTVTKGDDSIIGALVSEYKNTQSKRVVETYRPIPLEAQLHTRGLERGLEEAPVSTITIED